MKTSILYLAILFGINIGGNKRRSLLFACYRQPRKIITLPIYQFMTIRNWNTTSKVIVTDRETLNSIQV